ncbi:MAG: DUF3798 domain-containing protein [Deltaproteobacteria bacterium]|jgi:hypothetical protein|nr:DUF3798 domain-containing protein [Deltaproteobacteria bacterium]
MPQKRGRRTIWLVTAVTLVAAALFFFLRPPTEDNLQDKRRARRVATEPTEPTKPTKPLNSLSKPTAANLPAEPIWPQPSNITEDFHIGVALGSGFNTAGEVDPTRFLEKLYGQADQGGRIRRVSLPENFLGDLETTIARIEELAADPLMRVIVVSEAVPGTSEAFRKIRAKRPEIFLLAAESHEDLRLIAETADVVTNVNFIARGYLIPHTAKRMGAKTLVHVSVPRHAKIESIKRKKAVMEEVCQELGLNFVSEDALDPLGEAGLKGAQDFITEAIPRWLEKYGPQTAFFSTINAHAAPMIRQIVKLGGYYVEGDTPSPLLGYPDALALDVQRLDNDWSAINKLTENALVKRGAGGRLGSWGASVLFSHATALVEFGAALVLGKAEKTDFEKLLKCYERPAPGVRWRGDIFFDPLAGESLANVFLLFQDTYIYGLGNAGNVDLDIPAKYRSSDNNRFFRTAAPYHIGVVTGSSEQGGEDLLGALEMERRYGQADQGGLIKSVTYGDDFLEAPELAAGLIASLAEDPLIKVVVVNQALEGTAEGFRRLKAKRPDIICLASEPFEEAEIITATADMAIATDYLSRGYLIPYSAKTLGAKALIHLSFPRHMEMEPVEQRNRIMKMASEDLGLIYDNLDVLDPIGPKGADAAIKDISRVVGEALRKYGPQTAFFCTNDLLITPLVKDIALKGGIFVEADIPSLLLGYPTAFGVDIQPILGQWSLVLKTVEEAVVAAGGAGRLGTWAYPLGYSQTAGLVEFGKALADGRIAISDTQVFLEILDNLSPGARWNGSFFNDPKSGKPLRNYFLVYQDTYVFGRGYIETTKLDVPEKYYSLTK